MQRPHRSVPERLMLYTTSFGRQLPPSVRRKLRSLTGSATEKQVRSLPAETVEAFDAWQTLESMAGTICEVLENAGIEVVRLSRSGQEWLAVDASQQLPALSALRDSPVCKHWIAQPPEGRPRLLGSSHAAARESTILVYRHLRSPDGRYICGPEVSVTLEFWRATKAKTPRPDGGMFDRGTRLPPSKNRVVPYLPPGLWAEAQGRRDHRIARQDLPNLLELNEPVDAVYTWVDDNDPVWRELRESILPEASGLASDALDPARTRDRDELRYSLRSLAMHAGWVRRVWIVTAGQVPAWLNLDNDRVRVVSHAEIFSDPSALPVFNSHAIESQLHHIADLSEHFLYLNDDFFFGRPVRPELFFHGNGIPKMMPSPIAIDLDLDTDCRNGASLAARQSREWLERTFDRSVTNRMQHTPHPHLKSALNDLEAAMPTDVDRVAHSRFRHRSDLSIPSELGHYYTYATDRAVSGSMAFQYVDFDSPLAEERMTALLAARGADCFCVNDVGGGSASPTPQRLRQFLDDYFPVPSEFEVVGR